MFVQLERRLIVSNSMLIVSVSIAEFVVGLVILESIGLEIDILPFTSVRT